MYPFHSAHGRGGHPPPPQQNFPINQFQNPNLYHTILQQQQFIQNPHINTFPQFHPPHFQSNPFTIPTNNNNSIEKLDKAAVNAHREFLALGDTVSAWKVSSAALKSVNADSWESLGFQMQQVPSLNKLLTTEGKVNGFIHCFVAVREITSLYDLGVAVCESEGVGKFEDLGLGPLLRHPLVVHYFGVSCNVTTVYRITTEEIVSYLSEFVENRSKREVKVDTFLEFIAKERSVGGSEKLCVRIQNLGLYIKKIREAKLSLYTVLNKCFESLRSKAEKRSKKRPLFSVEKKQLDDHFSSISQRIQSFSSENKEFCGKHIRFESSSSDDHDSGADESEDSKAENNYPGSNTSDIKADRVSSCPYPSVTEEKTRLGLKTEANYAPGGGARRNNDTEIRNIRKRKSENVMSTTSPSYKQPKRDKSCVNHKNKSLDNKDDQCTDGYTASKEESPMFVTIWKEACQSNTAEEVVERMLRPYRIKGKRRVKELFTTFPFVGLLNVALAPKGKFYANHKNKHLDNDGSEDTDGYSLSSEKILKFVEAWRDSFRSSNANEVFQRMLKTYKTERRKKMKTMFTTYPFVGLLNAAVSSINSGMWDNMYDTFQVMALDDNDVKKADGSDDYISIAIEPAKEGVSSQKIVERKQVNVTAECIAKEISGYFEDEILDHKDLTGENKFSLLRKLCKCQSWLIQRYSITEFESLGYGEYFSFTQKHINLLPRALQNFFMGQTYENLALDARMLQPQLDVLLSQALSSTWENKNINLKTVAELLARQFPLVCFKLMASDLQENYLEGLREKVCKITSNCLLFSTPLLKSNCLSDSLVVSETKVRGTSDLDYAIEPKEGLAGAVTTKDAIEVLLKAPMLSNLILWSHWDLLFAPSLGSITEWFFKEVNTKELLCLVTKDGKIIRLDHSATLDSFLKVFIGGSAFETAVQLLSLLALYGGERSVPMSLLKCHAQKAFEVIVKNSSDIESEYNNHKNPHNETARVVSRFVLECLSYLPIEFCSFAADILLAGLQSFVKGVPLAILNDCKQIEQRLILHEVGFSLGVIEWVNDYHSFCFSPTSEFPHASSGVVTFKAEESSTIPLEISNRHPPSSVQVLDSDVGGVHCFGGDLESSGNASPEVSDDGFPSSLQKLTVLNGTDSDPVRVIESIREEEFGLNQGLSDTENRMLEKQHARLGRALHCLSQELYSQDSHFLLELVQNADDNIYPGNVEPTLMFILQEKGIVILNNEKGFSANNIRALCDVGNSTKKGHSAGYIGKKGIGFKSVFRVTDAPEIHSNGYHIKFDITQGQIGFVLPTIVPACDVNLYSRLASPDATSTDQSSWSTCIVLPFRSNSTEGFGMNNIISMFSDLHPSLLLFLHRLQCMKFRNVLDDSLIVMRKQVIGNGMVRVAVGNERMTWLVISKKLQADVIRSDVQTTEISLAFTLQETEDGGYTPILKQQPAFAFLPLRTYGLKFIIQGDFVLPSSREEVDSNSPWNQWLLSEFPDFFVSAERSFCGLPCYRGSIGKAITAYMSFIPVVGEVHGFFSSLPRMIVSKLRMSNCLVLEGNEDVWVPPCKVLRNWSEQTRSLLSDGLLQEHLGLGFLNKDIILSDILARTLGVEEYGPKILLNIISSISCSENGLKSMGLSWLSSCLSAIYVMLSHSSEISSSFVSESDFISSLKKIPLVPVSDGKFCSVDKETIWLHSEEVGHGVNEEYVLKAFPKLYAMLLIVSPNLLSAACSIKSSCSDTTVLENVVKMLYKVGVQRLSAHEILKEHILPAISDDKNTIQKENLMIEYLSFAMFHLQSNCASCSLERDDIITELRNKCLILTNYGYRRSNDVPIHFSREYNSPIDTNRLVTGLDMKWHEIDPSYLKHPITNCLSDGVLKWRTFFQDIGVTDFVQIVEVEKRVADIPFVNIKDMIWCRDTISADSMAKNWESEELCLLLSQLSSKHDPQKSMNLMEILDVLWDGYFNDKCAGHYIDTNGESKAFKSSLISILQDVPWVVSSIDNKLHYPKDLFHDCVSVSSVLGSSAPYTTPKVKSEKLVADIGIKTQVTIDDALSVLRLWKRHSPFQAFKASVSQMSNFYEFLWKGMASSKKSIIEELQSGRFVFVPYTLSCSNEDIVRGQLLTSQEVYWRDSTENAESVDPGPVADTSSIGKTLYNLYPTLHDFFVNECEVNQNPPLRGYLQILLQLSSSALPHESGKRVYKIFLKWADALNSGLLSPEDADYLKESLLRKENTVLPTRLDRWVSLHVSFGLVCWCDDGGLGKEFKNAEKVDFLYFGDYTDEENQMLHAKLSIIMQKIGIPVLSKIVTREAIYHGKEDCTSVYSMVNWILPFAQRYVYIAHPEKYFQLKQSAFENLRHLKIVVVENLFYRNIIKSCDVTSKKRHECDCLLQDNILYCSKGLNTHAIFLELSRLLYDGAPDLHFANFLHMITTMAESGATEEQTEFFIQNSQKVPKLPSEESSWSIQSSSVETDAPLFENYIPASQRDDEKNYLSKRKPGTISNWPPANWKTAPGFNSSSTSELKKQTSIGMQITEANFQVENLSAKEICGEVNIARDKAVATSTGTGLVNSEILEPANLTTNFDASGTDMELDSVDLISPEGMSSVRFRSNSNETNDISARQAQLTGRMGEFVAFKYFEGKAGEGSVKWVNEGNETGLPYDVVIGNDDDSREYIEVKATKYARKNWFLITMREWQFAIEKGEAFSIAHVTLGDDNMARVTVYKNPAKLCQIGNLKLAVVVPKE